MLTWHDLEVARLGRECGRSRYARRHRNQVNPSNAQGQAARHVHAGVAGEITASEAERHCADAQYSVRQFR